MATQYDYDQPAFDLNGLRAVVTGASSGIGRRIALQLAGAGADCVVHTRANATSCEEVAQAIGQLGRRAKVLMADLAEVEAQDRLVREVFGQSDSIDIWINNAGADVLTGDAAQSSFEEKLDMLWRVDVVSTIRLSRAVGQRMKSAGGGVIINMGWDQASIGMAGDSGEMFAATKGAIASFSKSLARSLAPEVRVNCLAPGWIRTKWGEQASQSWQQRAIDESLMERWGTPEDVARVAHFLVSPAAAFVTGQTIEVNGGRRNS